MAAAGDAVHSSRPNMAVVVAEGVVESSAGLKVLFRIIRLQSCCNPDALSACACTSSASGMSALVKDVLALACYAVA